jgi:uncharacterized ion transporter superfamily protein YfcC
MATLKQLQTEVNKIKQRNNRVEGDKAWETSLTRKGVIAILTYAVIVIFFYAAQLPDPFINAIVPTVGFVLSTLTIPLAKKLWMKYNDV